MYDSIEILHKSYTLLFVHYNGYKNNALLIVHKRIHYFLCIKSNVIRENAKTEKELKR
jgi:hypothetical protein